MRDPTPDDLRAVAAMADSIERVRDVPYEGQGYPVEIQALMRAIADRGLQIGFAWASWTAQAQRFVDDDTALASASLDEVRRLLTFHVRSDRFNGGHFVDMVKRGHIGAVLRRLAVLAAAT